MTENKQADKEKPTKKAKKSPKAYFKASTEWAKKRQQNFLLRRPHRSFRRSRRRDYKRSLSLPGYWAFTYEVWLMLWKHRRLFLLFIILYVMVTLLTIGLLSQQSYTGLSEVFFGKDDSVGVLNDVGAVTSALALFAATVAGAMTHQLEQPQQIIGGFILLMGWLVVVWLLRQLMAGHTVRLRDALYNAGGPIIPMVVVTMVLMFQLIPFALALVAYNVAAENGYFVDGVEAMTIWAGLLLIGLLSLYWITSSLVALVIVSLPGTYPFDALKMAGDLVVGRRLRIMLRLVWLVIGLLPAWAIVVIPLIFLEGVTHINWLPIVPIAILLLSAGTTLWASAYIYLLYRKLIDDETPPA